MEHSSSSTSNILQPAADGPAEPDSSDPGEAEPDAEPQRAEMRGGSCRLPRRRRGICGRSCAGARLGESSIVEGPGGAAASAAAVPGTAPGAGPAASGRPFTREPAIARDGPWAWVRGLSRSGTCRAGRNLLGSTWADAVPGSSFRRPAPTVGTVWYGASGARWRRAVSQAQAIDGDRIVPPASTSPPSAAAAGAFFPLTSSLWDLVSGEQWRAGSVLSCEVVLSHPFWQHGQALQAFAGGSFVVVFRPRTRTA